MATFNLLQSGLVLHILGIIMMVGISLAEFVIFHQLLGFIPDDRDKAYMVLKTTSRFPLWQATGGGMIILGGILMMAALRGTIAGQLWFQIKMTLLFLLILNALLIARPAKRKLRKWLTGSVQQKAEDPSEIREIKRKIRLFHTSQLLLFFVIIMLAVFRFN
ncbi:MAG TPA: hypothetical protein VL727_19685 [Puia sp.]|nr:hypothetical protein [Puia sp.]